MTTSSPQEALVNPSQNERAQPWTWEAEWEISAYRRVGKRLFDLVIGLTLLIAALPVILALAVAVIATSGWPPFYGGVRVGKYGNLFHMWKLRTMVRQADRQVEEWKTSNPQLAASYLKDFKIEDDPRITRIGRFLRRSSLDELPQLLNVVRGEMSLVGPRPIVPDELSHYGDKAPVLLSCKPGLTGLWQVSGRNQISYPQRVAVELECCASISLWSDIQLLLRTAAVALKRDGL